MVFHLEVIHARFKCFERCKTPITNSDHKALAAAGTEVSTDSNVIQLVPMIYSRYRRLENVKRFAFAEVG